MTDYESLRQQVLDYTCKLAHDGFLKGTGGNVSVRAPGEKVLAITPSNQDYLTMTPDDICVYSFEQERILGTQKPSIEMSLHITVYQTRPDAGSVMHTHQEFASAIALIKKSIPALFDEQVRFLGRSVDVVPYAPSGTGMLAKQVRKTVKNNHNAYLMKNHGALCLGPTPERAYHNVLLLEKAAIAYLLALCTDEKISKIPVVVREIAFAKLRSEQKKLAEKE